MTARQHSGAVNPLHSGHDGAAFSDAFLAMTVVVVLALIVAFRMRHERTFPPGRAEG